MKYILSCRQSKEYLAKADYLYVEWRDREGLITLGHDYPNKNFLFFLSNDQIEPKELKKYNSYTHNNLYCRIFTEEQLKLCQEAKVKYYFGMPFTSLNQLQGAKDNGASLAYITSPLTNDLKAVKNIGIPVFTFANLATEIFPSTEKREISNWIRPEDVKLYNGYIDALCFAWKDLKQERALYRVYAEVGFWSGKIGDIIIDLNNDALNRMIPETFAENRINCRQACLNGIYRCDICKNALSLAHKDIIEPYKKQTELFKKVKTN